MNEQILFDRLRYMDKLKSAGISESHARAHADAMDEALRESVATKTDIALLRNDIQIAVKDMTIRIGVASASIIGALAAIKYFG